MALFQRLKTPFVEDAPRGEAVSPGGSLSAGDVLRQRRETLGLDLRQVAGTLRIKPAYLAALEEGRLDQLPGPAYAAGFLRAYGEHLGLDGTEILRRFKVELAGLDAKPDLSFPMPLGERGVPGGTMLLVAFILAICGYGTWYYLSTDDRSRPERVTEVPIALLPPKPVEPASAAGAPVDLWGRGGTDTLSPATNIPPLSKAVASAEPSLSEAAATPTGEPVSASTTATATVLTMPALAATLAPIAAAPNPPSPPAQRGEGSPTYGVADGPVRIVMRAIADSWIQVRDADRSVLFTRVLKTGESYRVPERAGVSMRTGNAGGLEITVDGKTAPPLGPMGAVRRNVALDPELLMAGTAARD